MVAIVELFHFLAYTKETPLNEIDKVTFIARCVIFLHKSVILDASVHFTVKMFS